MILFWIATAISLVTAAAVHGYYNIGEIKANWSAYRCNPAYMLMAGVVDPETGIARNFYSCLNLIGKEVVGGLTSTLGIQFSLIGDMLSSIANPLSIFRTVINSTTKFIMSFASSSLGKGSGPLSMFVFYLNKIQDLIRRMVGQGYIAAFFGITVVSFIKGFISLIIGVIKAFVIAMLIIAVILALFQPQILVIVLIIASSLAAAGA